jgi:catechol 2,3-dioxygenase-like lactoylglutathione lyase family enzyme
MSVRAVRHAGVVVRDADRSLAFYRDALGLSVISDQLERGPFIGAVLGLPGVEVRTVKLGAAEGEALVELLEFAGQAPGAVELADLRRLGPTHVALTVDDLPTLHARLSAAGTPFRSAPLASADGRALVAFCADPDGTVLELVEPR